MSEQNYQKSIKKTAFTLDDPLKSMWNNSVDNKIYNLNFSVTFNFSNNNPERSSPSKNSAELRFRLFSKRSIVAKKLRVARLLLALSHSYTFHVVLNKKGETIWYCRNMYQSTGRPGGNFGKYFLLTPLVFERRQVSLSARIRISFVLDSKNK